MQSTTRGVGRYWMIHQVDYDGEGWDDRCGLGIVDMKEWVDIGGR